MHSMHSHQDGTGSIRSPATDYSIDHSSSPFSALHILRNYRLFGTSAGPAVAAAAAAAAAAADFVTNPGYEFLYPHHHHHHHHQSEIGPVPCSYREYGVIADGYKHDSLPLSSSSKRILIGEDSSSSSSPPVQRAGASSSSTSPINTLPISPNLLRQQSNPLSAGTLPAANSLVSMIRQPALINAPQQFPDSPNFAETGVDRSRRFFVGETSGGLSSCRSRRPRSEKRPIPDEQKDDKYYERRKRNNQAAKKSRDARKIREDHIALRATMLEHENAILRTQILALREEAQSLRRMLIEQQMPKLQGRFVIDCPRSGHVSTTRPSSSGSNVNIASATTDSSSNGTILFTHPSSKVTATLLV